MLNPLKLATVGVALAAGLVLGVGSALSVYQPGEPPNIDPGTPPFTGLANPVPAEPAAGPEIHNEAVRQ